jgi:hypothetical protein
MVCSGSIVSISTAPNSARRESVVRYVFFFLAIRQAYRELRLVVDLTRREEEEEK